MAARRESMAVPDLYHLDRAGTWIVQLYEAWGRSEKAAEWRRKLAAESGKNPALAQ
jgi:hypothetical protein